MDDWFFPWWRVERWPQRPTAPTVTPDNPKGPQDLVAGPGGASSFVSADLLGWPARTRGERNLSSQLDDEGEWRFVLCDRVLCRPCTRERSTVSEAAQSTVCSWEVSKSASVLADGLTKRSCVHTFGLWKGLGGLGSREAILPNQDLIKRKMHNSRRTTLLIRFIYFKTHEMIEYILYKDYKLYTLCDKKNILFSFHSTILNLRSRRWYCNFQFYYVLN